MSESTFELPEADRRLFGLKRWTGSTARRLVKLFEESGLSTAEFAAAGGVGPERLEKLLERERARGEGAGFAAVETAPTGGAPVVVHVGHASIEITAGFDAALLRAVVSALPC